MFFQNMLNVKLCSQKCIFRTKSNIYDGAFYAKIVKDLQLLIIFAKLLICQIADWVLNMPLDH